MLASNTFLSLQDVAIFSFPGNGFQTGGDQHHVELVNCRITYPPNSHRSITLTGGGFMLDQSHGFIKLENCDFGYSGAPHGEPQALHNAGRLAWGSGLRGEAPEYTGLDVIIVRDGKIAALYVFLDSMP